MNKRRWLLAAQSELNTYGRRNRFLLDHLEQPALDVASAAGPGNLCVVEVTAGGYGAYRLRELTVSV